MGPGRRRTGPGPLRHPALRPAGPLGPGPAGPAPHAHPTHRHGDAYGGSGDGPGRGTGPVCGWDVRGGGGERSDACGWDVHAGGGWSDARRWDVRAGGGSAGGAGDGRAAARSGSPRTGGAGSPGPAAGDRYARTRHRYLTHVGADACGRRGRPASLRRDTWPRLRRCCGSGSGESGSAHRRAPPSGWPAVVCGEPGDGAGRGSAPGCHGWWLSRRAVGESRKH